MSSLCIFSLFAVFRDVYSETSMIIMWGEAYSNSTPEAVSYQFWNDCLEACSRTDDCVATAFKSEIESDGCNLYFFNKITNALTSNNTTSKIGFKIDLNFSTCPSELLNPPLFGKSAVYTIAMNPSLITTSNLAEQRKRLYVITEPSEGQYNFTYGGCLEDESIFIRNDTSYCLKKYEIQVSDYSDAETGCAENKGFLHNSISLTEWEQMKKYLGNSSRSYWLDGKIIYDKQWHGSCYMTIRLNASIVGYFVTGNHCLPMNTCAECPQYTNGYQDRNCTDSPAGFLCIFNL